MVTFTDLRMSLLKLGLSHTPVIAHASLSEFGEVVGGAESLLRAVLDSVWCLVMPTFTYNTMITPQVGPPNNAIVYGGETSAAPAAEPFTPDLPADAEMGVTSEALRLHAGARRSSHPILSFAGVRAERFLRAQTLAEPFAIIGELAADDGWILLLGVDHSANTSIHYAERLAGRKQFVRWALLEDRVVECPGFPGDSAGFEGLAAALRPDARQIRVGETIVQAMPIRIVIRAVRERLAADPLALLCTRPGCARCNAVGTSVGEAAPVS